jgi:hypothetical protein
MYQRAVFSQVVQTIFQHILILPFLRAGSGASSSAFSAAKEKTALCQPAEHGYHPFSFLRWHYPNQVPGKGVSPTLSLPEQAPPFCFLCLYYINHLQQNQARAFSGRRKGCFHGEMAEYGKSHSFRRLKKDG